MSDKYFYLPTGSVIKKLVIVKGKEVLKEVTMFPPHLQCKLEGGRVECFIIPKIDKDRGLECTGRSDCYFYLNRGYYCKKHDMSNF